MVAQLDKEYASLRPRKVLTRLISYALFEGRPVTTRGRWLNPLVFGILNQSKRLNLANRVNKPIFIVGTGRSGTTVLGMILSMHREVGFLNEPKALWHTLYPYEDISGSYSQGKASYRLDASQADPAVRRAAHRVFSFYLLVTGSKRLVDKYPELIFRASFVRALFPDAKFLFLVRSGWDTCRSIATWSERLGSRQHDETHDWWGVDGRKWKMLLEQIVAFDPVLGPHLEPLRQLDRHLDMAAVEWIVSMREGLKLLSEHPESVHSVRYEDLALRPVEILTDLLAFCELEPDGALYTYARNILHPSEPKPPFALNTLIRPAFEEMMDELGYRL